MLLNLLTAKMKIAIAAAVIAVIVSGVRYYGHTQYQAGVVDTTERFVKADTKGAKDVKDTATKILKDTVNLSDDAIIDSLRASGGLRPDLQ